MQFQFAWPLGPENGRYPVRSTADARPEAIVIFSDDRAEPRRRKRRRRTKAVQPDTASFIDIQRVTVIDTAEFDEGSAGKFDTDRQLHSALQTLNGILGLWRVAARDPYAQRVRAEQALTVRCGYGTGAEVADGKWTSAAELGEKKQKRRSLLDPHERLAKLLNRKATVFEFEEFALRSREYLDCRSYTAAALELDLALDIAIEEFEQTSSIEKDQLQKFAVQIEEIANSIVGREVSADEIGQLEAAQVELERVVKKLSQLSDN